MTAPHSSPRRFPSTDTPPDPLGREFADWAAVGSGLGLPTYAAEQIFAALHRGWIGDWDQATELSRAARSALAREHPLRAPAVAAKIAARDGTVRYLLELHDGERVEAVYLPDEVFAGAAGEPTLRRRATLCLSTQVGCPVNCQFCLTALLGLKRSLSAGEIVGQARALLRDQGLAPGAARRAGRDVERLNLVYMGMGEPFLNYEAVLRSVRVLTDPRGLGLSPRRITISTSGIVEKIRRFGGEPNRPRLAISLNAASDELRQRLMPINRAQGGLTALLAAAREFPLAAREFLTFEYVLLAGVNDAPEDAAHLARLTRGMRRKFNLIAWNPGPELPLRPPTPEHAREFQARLIAEGAPAYIRRPRGPEIFAACGQLSGRGGGGEPAAGAIRSHAGRKGREKTRA